MESHSSSALSSYFRHGTVTAPPIVINTQPGGPSATSLMTAVASSVSNTSSPPSSTSIASSTSTSTWTSSSGPTSLASSSSPFPSSTLAVSSTTSSSRAPNNGFGNPSASAVADHTGNRPYNPSSLVVVLSVFGVLVASVTIWLIIRYFNRRRQAHDVDLDRPRPNQEGWAKRMTFTGNREKFWQRLDDYHESLKAREEGRVKRSMAGVSMGQVPRFSTVPRGLDIHPSFQPTPITTATTSTTTTPAAAANKNRSSDNISVKTFMIGSEDELAYLHTVLEDDRKSTPAHSRPPPSVPMSANSSTAGSIKGGSSQGGEDGRTAVDPFMIQSDQVSDKRVQSLARSTPLPASGSEDSIDRLDLADTGTRGAVKSILISHEPHPTQVLPPKDEAKLKPAQHHLSAISNYSTPSSSYLTPDFIPLSQMAHQKNQPDYRSPTESIYGCYKTDEERHASFISTTTAGGAAAGPPGVPAVPPIPPSYRK